MIIKKMNLDLLNDIIYEKVEKLMLNDIFKLSETSKSFPSCFINLIKFELGVMEYFSSTRKYCLNYFDYYILDDKEIYFYKRMNENFRIYYKIKSYTFNNCQEYHKNSINLLKRIDLQQNLGYEIKDINFEEKETKEINYINSEPKEYPILEGLIKNYSQSNSEF